MKVLTLLGAAALLGLSHLPAEAGYGAPFCARVNGGAFQGAYDDCSYVSFEQCRISTIGVGGFCVQNPYYAWRGPDPFSLDPRRRAPRYRY